MGVGGKPLQALQRLAGYASKKDAFVEHKGAGADCAALVEDLMTRLHALTYAGGSPPELTLSVLGPLLAYHEEATAAGGAPLSVLTADRPWLVPREKAETQKRRAERKRPHRPYPEGTRLATDGRSAAPADGQGAAEPACVARLMASREGRQQLIAFLRRDICSLFASDPCALPSGFSLVMDLPAGGEGQDEAPLYLQAGRPAQPLAGLRVVGEGDLALELWFRRLAELPALAAQHPHAAAPAARVALCSTDSDTLLYGLLQEMAERRREAAPPRRRYWLRRHEGGRPGERVDISALAEALWLRGLREDKLLALCVLAGNDFFDKAATSHYIGPAALAEFLEQHQRAARPLAWPTAAFLASEVEATVLGVQRLFYEKMARRELVTARSRRSCKGAPALGCLTGARLLPNDLPRTYAVLASRARARGSALRGPVPLSARDPATRASLRKRLEWFCGYALLEGIADAKGGCAKAGAL